MDSLKDMFGHECFTSCQSAMLRILPFIHWCVLFHNASRHTSASSQHTYIGVRAVPHRFYMRRGACMQWCLSLTPIIIRYYHIVHTSGGTLRRILSASAHCFGHTFGEACPNIPSRTEGDRPRKKDGHDLFNHRLQSNSTTTH